MHTVAQDAVTQLKILAHTHTHAYIIICIYIYRLNLDTYTCARHLISIRDIQFSSTHSETAETSSQFSRSPAVAPSLSLSPFGNCHSNVCRSSPNYNNVGSHIRYTAGAGLRVYVAAGVDRLFHYLQCGAQALSRHGCHRWFHARCGCVHQDTHARTGQRTENRLSARERESEREGKSQHAQL